MKFITVFILIFGIFIGSLISFEYGKFGGGNGTVLRIDEVDGCYTLVRQHVQNILVDDYVPNKQRTMYDQLGSVTVKYFFDIGEIIQIKELVLSKELTTGDESLWFHVTNNKNENGWIFIGTNSSGRENAFVDPYKNNNWEICSNVNTNSKTFTERKMSGIVSVFENLNIRNNPGIKDSLVIDVIRPQQGQQLNLEVLAITEEYDYVDGITDRWIKITYKDQIGWIFGGYTHYFGGGLKFNIPEVVVQCMFNY